MKKYITLCLALLVPLVGSMATKAMGPMPLPYSTPTYQSSPAYRMNAQQKYFVQQGFAWAQTAFLQNHSVCRNRGECLNLDLSSLSSYIGRFPTHPATPFFQNIYNVIRHDSVTQKFVSEWIIFQNLSPSRQLEYRRGLRITPIQPQYVITPARTTAPAIFNQDDVLTDLLQAVDHFHKNCNQYITCLRGDLQIINNLSARLAITDPVRISLMRLRQAISNIALTRMFNTNLYLNLYNPLSTSWYDMSRKYKAQKIGAYGYTEWRQIERSSRPTIWRSPRIINKYAPPRDNRTWWQRKRDWAARRWK